MRNTSKKHLDNYTFNRQYSTCKPNITTEILNGLLSVPKHLSPKFFYDQKGSELFEKITNQPEYYVTRKEISILQTNCNDIANTITKTPQHNISLLELGSGNSTKVQILLETLRPNTYIPIDISETFLKENTLKLTDAFPWLNIHAISADYCHALPSLPPNLGKKVAFFPGSSIGNFEPAATLSFLKNIAKWIEPTGGLLIGVDLIKSQETLNLAYNDLDGVTAAFNLNILCHINRLTQAGFKPHQFKHKAFFNNAASRIEMHLESTIEQSSVINNQTITFKAGESIHTENSYKYSIDSFSHLAKQAGLKPVKVWTDSENWFSVHYLESI